MATAPLSNLTATWNASGTTFNAIKMNVTDTASAAASLLLDLQVGGTSQFRVSKGGAVSVGSTIELGHASDTTLARGSAGVLTVEGNTVYTSSNLPGTAITWTAGQRLPDATKIYGNAGTFRLFSFQTGTSDRFRIGLENTAESGSNAGSNFGIYTIADDGTSTLSAAISITRSSGIVNFASVPTRAGNAIFDAANLPGTAITWTADQTLSNVNLVLATGAGTKIGTATNQKLGFFNATPVVQPTAVADATDAASVITQLNALLSRMRTLGLIAT